MTKDAPARRCDRCGWRYVLTWMQRIGGRWLCGHCREVTE